jgi:hypothetical protein
MHPETPQRDIRDRPILFLDVDGVLNCFNAIIPVTVINRGSASHAEVPEGTRQRLSRLTPLFEPVWATGWGSRAHLALAQHLCLTGEVWRHLIYQERKLLALLQAASGRPWAWVDDDSMLEIDDAGFQVPHACLVICPDPREGLNDHHVDLLVAYAANRWVPTDPAVAELPIQMP